MLYCRYFALFSLFYYSNWHIMFWQCHTCEDFRAFILSRPILIHFLNTPVAIIKTTHTYQDAKAERMSCYRIGYLKCFNEIIHVFALLK